MSFLKSLFEKWFSDDRRKLGRQPSPQLVAYYFTGAAPVGYPVRDISLTGLYLLTDERWRPGTVIMMTIQRMDEVEESADRSIALHAKVVRWGEDGVGFAFALSDSRSGNQLADKKVLHRFLETIKPGEDLSVISY
jgi:hypothetical protein